MHSNHVFLVLHMHYILIALFLRVIIAGFVGSGQDASFRNSGTCTDRVERALDSCSPGMIALL